MKLIPFGSEDSRGFHYDSWVNEYSAMDAIRTRRRIRAERIFVAVVCLIVIVCATAYLHFFCK